MKPLQFLTSCAGILVAAAMLCGCTQNQSGPGGAPKQVSTEKNSFQEVTAKLDAGGDLYAYLSTEKLLEGVSAKVSSWRGICTAIPEVGAANQEKIEKAFDLVTNLIKNSGIEDVSGVGMSSIAVEKDFYHHKLIVHHYKGKGTGYLWTTFGRSPHALQSQSYLPASTALAMFGDADAAQVWAAIKKETAGFPEAEQLLAKVPETFQNATGLEWDKVLASLGGEYGFVLTLDDTRKITVPLPSNEGPLEVPEPGLMLMAKVKDDVIFDRIEQALVQMGQQVTRVDKPYLKMRTVPVPIPFVPLRPTLARSGDYMFIATTDALVLEAVAVQAGQKPGLKSTDEFRHLAKDVPQEGNAYSFISPRLGRTILDLQQKAMGSLGQLQGQQFDTLRSMMTNQAPGFCYNVAGFTDEGLLVVGNGNQHPAKVLLASTAVPIAVASAVALPALAKAKARAQSHQKAEQSDSNQ